MVKVWKETVMIPTYEVGAPEKAPMFLEKRVYQGSSGVVYPYPVIESISDSKTDRPYEALYLENEYIKVMILPELGGRVQMAYDKVKKRHFVYYNHVIKPALVGLAGPWISGGIEFNWPQHHRPSTYMPVDWKLEEHADGSATVWVSEVERMFHQKGMAGFTLRPHCAYLEIHGVLFNPTPMPQTFLWWANPAVAVGDAYQSVFPPDVNAVFDHGKRAVSRFPIATGTYYKMDYSAGVDISNYRNIKVPTSYMVASSVYDFEGGYENDTRAGMLHVANHHLSPGKKQWTWGNGDFGQAWDRNLTDADGPYIELMAGVYTENQPDFTWLMPYEEKSFVQYFLPYRELGVVKNATKDVLLNVDPVDDGRVRVRVFATSPQKLEVVLRADDGGREIWRTEAELSPEQLLDTTVDAGGADVSRMSLVIRDAQGREILTWHALPEDEVRPQPEPAEAALRPEEIKTTEQLYLTGLHLEQYRHATYNPVDYYEEALRRDPLDVRNNNALGLWYLRRGRWDKAEGYLRTAVKVLMKRNPNPYDGEPVYNLALALWYQGRTDEAYRWFYKSTWNAAWQGPGYLWCARISTLQRRYDDALDEVEKSLVSGWHNHEARGLKTALLRLTGRLEEARRWAEESLEADAFNFFCLNELRLLGAPQAAETQAARMRQEAHNYNEAALDYAAAGLWSEAVGLLQKGVECGASDPMTYYYMAWCLEHTDAAAAAEMRCKAASMSPDYCFPNRLEAVLALRVAEAENPADAHAPYYLGCLYYDKRQYDLAIAGWQESARRDDTYAITWRNLALAALNKQQDEENAVTYMERAFSLAQNDARLLMELDQLYKRLHRPHAERLAHLQRYPELIRMRDDLILEEATLLNFTGAYQEAMTLIDGHQFHPWEGGEGKVSGQYQMSRVELAKKAMAGGRMEEACRLLEECLTYPHHLGEGKLHGAQENDFYYLLGCAHQALGQADEAHTCWLKAITGPTEPAAALYYNDAKPDKIFYQGLALRQLGREDEARGRFNRLVDYGERHLFDEVRMDYFAVSLPDLLIWDDSLQLRNEVHCKYMMALGHLGLGNRQRALRLLEEARRLDNNHMGIYSTFTLIEELHS